MKKLAIVLCVLLALTACNKETAVKSNSNENTAVSQSEQETSSDKQENSNIGKKVTDPNIGTFTVVNQSGPINKEYSSGPLKLFLKSISVMEFEPTKQAKELFGEDIKSTIFVEMKTSNTEKETNSFYPDQGVLVVNEKEQINADLASSEELGGEFIGTVEKEGVVVFYSKTPANEIKSFKLKVDAAHDENLNTLGEDILIDYSYK